MKKLYKKAVWMGTAAIFSLSVLTGCQQKAIRKDRGQRVDYVLCQSGHMPGELEKMIEENKEEGGAFAYKNSMYTYLVVCYGMRESSGYSIRVEECRRTDGVLFLRTQLMGPEEGELAAKEKTFPYIVVRCKRTEDFCMIET